MLGIKVKRSFPKRNIYQFGTIIVVLILTVAVLVSGLVISSYVYPTNTNSVKPLAYLAQGPQYNIASSNNIFYVRQTGDPANVSSGSIIYINETITSNLIVLRVNNTASIPCTIWINGTLKHVTMYINGTIWSSGTKENVPANTGYIDISFSLSHKKTVTTDYLTFEYNFGNGVVIYYYYQVYVNS